MPKRDFYDILGIARSATPELIRAAHRVQSRRYHPDTADDGKGDAVRFAEIQEAYDTLSSPDNRRRYDTKEGFARGEFSGSTKRRPPKTACGACGKLVYASQLKLYLGRHMCQPCFDRKREREVSRPRLTVVGETFWKLKRIRVWAQSHFALLAVFVVAIGAVGIRLEMVSKHAHRAARETDDTSPEANENSSPTAPVISSPCPVPPPAYPQTADLRSTHSGDK